MKRQSTDARGTILVVSNNAQRLEILDRAGNHKRGIKSLL